MKRPRTLPFGFLDLLGTEYGSGDTGRYSRSSGCWRPFPSPSFPRVAIVPEIPHPWPHLGSGPHINDKDDRHNSRKRGYTTGGSSSCGIGIGQRRDDLLDDIEIGVARIHAELLRCLTQIDDGRFLKHEQSLPEKRGGHRTRKDTC